MNIQVEKSDVWKIGRGCWYDEGGFLAIECNVDTVNYDHILLRSILKCYGENYTVTNALEHICKEDEDLIDGYTLVTNLPFEKFEELAKDRQNNKKGQFDANGNHEKPQI